MTKTYTRTGKSVHGYTSDEARDGWQTFANKHFVTISSILEALGRRMADGQAPGDIATDELVADCRQIDLENRGRRGKGRAA